MEMKRNFPRTLKIASVLFLPHILLIFCFLFVIVAEISPCAASKGKINNNILKIRTESRDKVSLGTISNPAVNSDHSNADLIPYEGIGQNCEEYDSCSDKLGFEAIRTLHRQLDDDANGNVDISESDEFLRDELQYENGYERQKSFHGNDKHISVDELWRTWKQSEVHNWTVDETIQWLIQFVELPQYTKSFEENAIDGAALPRIAVNNQFLSSILGIKDSIHKQKLSLKAMDIVLFGIPRHRNYLKDILLTVSLLIAVTGCWFAYAQHKSGQMHIKKMMQDMESLQKAEDALQMLQYELDKAREEQMTVTMEKKNLERKLHSEVRSSLVIENVVNSEDCDSKSFQQLKEEVFYLRNVIKQNEGAGWKPPSSLQHWLQLTHELELKHFTGKKVAAENQLVAAKEGCEKLRRKRSTFLGTFRIAHGSNIDDVDNRIVQARAALSEITKEFKERLHRWKQIEQLSSFPIVSNPGLLQLETLLQIPVSNGSGITQSISSVSIASTLPSCLGTSEQSNNAFFVATEKLSASSSESAIDASSQSRQFEDNLPSEEECTDDDVDDLRELDSMASSSEHGRAVFKIGDSAVKDFHPAYNRGQMFKSYSHDSQSPPREFILLSRSESSLEHSSTVEASDSSIGTRVQSSQVLTSSHSQRSFSKNLSQTSDDSFTEKKNRSFLHKLKKRKLKVP